MVLSTLRLSNYKQYGHLELEFREGLVGIIGKNGAGKSTLFEAILYCLFGRDEGNKTHIRSAFAEPKSIVELQLEFTIGEIMYRVRREFRGKTMTAGAELFKNDLLVAKGVSTVNEELVKVLHIERDAFKRSVFSGQKELSELSDTTGEARKRMVRRMLGLDTLDDAQARVNTDLRDLNSQAAGQRQNLLSDEAIATLNAEMAEREKALAENKKMAKTEAEKLNGIQEKHRAEKERFDLEETRFKQHSSIRNTYAQAEERLAGLIRQKEGLSQKETDLVGQKEALNATRTEFSAYETEKQTLDKMEIEHTRHINRQARESKIAETKEQLEALGRRIQTLLLQTAELPRVESALREKQQSVDALESRIEGKRGELRELDKQIGGIEKSVSERMEKLKRLRALGQEGNCPTCLQPLLDGYERALAELENEINALQTKQLQELEVQKKGIVAAGTALKEQQTVVRNEVEKLLQEKTRLGESARQLHTEESQKRLLEDRLATDEVILREIGVLQFDEGAYQQLKSKLAAQESRYREYLAQENYIARELPATHAALKTTEANIEAARLKTAELQTGLGAVGYEESAYLSAKQAVAEFTEAFQAQTQVLRVLEKTGLELENAQSRAAETLRSNERIRNLISAKLEEVELLRRLYDLLGLFKTEILERVSPGISREASELFSRITRGKYEGILVDENFDFAIADGGQFYPIERFSGGEVDLANFCLRIAITKAIMDLSGAAAERRMEFLAFDEIFGSQDEERRLEMMLALNYLQEQFRQIYIVSHIESLKDYFPHLLEVQFAAEGSTAVWK